MAKPRNYWVLRGLRGQTARQRYLDYLSGVAVPDDNIGQGGDRPPSTSLYLEPFSLPLAVDHIMRDTALSTAWAAMGGVGSVGTYVASDPAGKTVVNSKSYKAPRLVRVEVDTTGVREVSKITGLAYLKYDNKSLSIPFGSNTVGDTVQSVYSTLSTAIVGGSNLIRTRLIDERS